MDLIELYRYFAKFVPLEVLKKNYLKAKDDQGAASIQAEVLADESTHRIASIGEYLFMGDSDFLMQRLRNSNKQLLMVDSDKLNYKPDHDYGSKMSIGLSVCEHYNRTNTDVVSELALQNRCLETLKSILDYAQEELDGSCPTFWLEDDFEIRFLDAKALNGLIGYTAFFTITAPTYKPEEIIPVGPFSGSIAIRENTMHLQALNLPLSIPEQISLETMLPAGSNYSKKGYSMPFYNIGQQESDDSYLEIAIPIPEGYSLQLTGPDCIQMIANVYGTANFQARLLIGENQGNSVSLTKNDDITLPVPSEEMSFTGEVVLRVHVWGSRQTTVEKRVYLKSSILLQGTLVKL